MMGGCESPCGSLPTILVCSSLATDKEVALPGVGAA